MKGNTQEINSQEDNQFLKIIYKVKQSIDWQLLKSENKESEQLYGRWYC